MWLGDFTTAWQPRNKVRCVDRIGWHGDVFVLSDRTYGTTGGERVILQTADAPPPQPATVGTLDWLTH